MEGLFANLINTRITRERYVDTIIYETYESNCETIGQLVDFLELEYPAKEDREWWKVYVNNITQDGNKFIVEKVSPYTG